MITAVTLAYIGLSGFGTGVLVHGIATNEVARDDFMRAMRERPVWTVVDLTAAAPFVGLGGVAALLVVGARRLWGALCGR